MRQNPLHSLHVLIGGAELRDARVEVEASSTAAPTLTVSAPEAIWADHPTGPRLGTELEVDGPRGWRARARCHAVARAGSTLRVVGSCPTDDRAATVWPPPAIRRFGLGDVEEVTETDDGRIVLVVRNLAD